MCSPDGQWVLYRDYARQRLRKVPLEGGSSQQLSDVPLAGNFDISPDGKFAAFVTFEHVGEHKQKLVLVPLDSGAAQILELQKEPSNNWVRFARDGKAILYPVSNGTAGNLWQQPLDGSPGRQITDFKSERIGDGFAFSPDGKRLAIIRGHVDSDVVVIRDAR